VAPAAVPGGDAPSTAPASAPPFLGVVPPQPVAPPSAPPAPTPFKPLNVGDSEEQPEEGTLRESDPDEDDPENSMSLAAIEAELKPKVLEIFDAIADTFKRLRRLRDQDIHNKLHNESLSPAQERKYKKLKKEIIVEMKSLRHQAALEADEASLGPSTLPLLYSPSLVVKSAPEVASLVRWYTPAEALRHHVHDLAELADLEPDLARERVYVVAVLLDLVLVLGDEAFPALGRQLRHAVEPERVELGAQVGLEKVVARNVHKGERTSGQLVTVRIGRRAQVCGVSRTLL
jgi:hypothetical protein